MVHPMRWLGGGSLFGADEGPPCCAQCSVPIHPDSPEPYCPNCLVLRAEERQRQREAAERGEGEAPPEPPLHIDGSGW